jgi:nitroreductase
MQLEPFFLGFDDSFNKLLGLRNDLNKHISNYPPYNIKKLDENEFELEFAIAGFDKKDIKVTVNNGKLNISGMMSDDENNFAASVQPRTFEFFGAPVAVFFFMDDSLTPWSTLDMGLFLQTFTLAAHGAGLGTCMQASVSGYPNAIRNFLGVPSTKRLIVSMSLGYPDMQAPLNSYKSTRMDVDAFTTWHK